MNETSYKNEMLEGGEGYNPHTITESYEYDKDDRMAYLLRVMNGCSVEDSRYAGLKAEYDKLFTIDWSLHATIERRETWNAQMAAEKKAGRKINLDSMQRKMGFHLASLKKAVEIYKLRGEIA